MDENNYFEDEVLEFKDIKHITKRFLKSMWRQKTRLIVVVSSVVFYTLFTILAPLYSAVVVDLIWGQINLAISEGRIFKITWEFGGIQVFILLFLYLASAAFYSIQTYLMASFSEKLSLQLREEIVDKLSRLSLSFFDRYKIGELMSRITNDLDKVSEALQMGLLNLFTAICVIIGSIVIMFYYNVILTLIFLIFVGILLFMTKLVSKLTFESSLKRQESAGKLNGLIEEFYSGRSIIRAFNYEVKSSNDIYEATHTLAIESQKAEFIINAIHPASRMMYRIGQCIILAFGAFMLIDKRLTLGRFQAFFQYLNQMSEPLAQLSFMISSMHSALASMERIYNLLDEEEISIDPEYALDFTNIKGDVSFVDVKFGYSDNAILMENMSFTANAGQKIAIVGSTGAGKTTLVNLLMRFYEINSGSILIDGINIKDVSRRSLRENFGMVLQDTWLFEGTIAENISYGKPSATREEIVKAAKAARADFFIRTMPDGYDTVLKNDAENISLGQRQLLTIARVILCNPAMLILDEATASVDTRTEMEINKAMSELMENRTSFVIAHRLSTIVDANLIFVMKEGKIVEQGNHIELIKKKGEYAELYNSQFR